MCELGMCKSALTIVSGSRQFKFFVYDIDSVSVSVSVAVYNLCHAMVYLQTSQTSRGKNKRIHSQQESINKNYPV